MSSTKLNLLNKSKSDEYYTPIYVWEDVSHILNKYKKLIEPFMLNSTSTIIDELKSKLKLDIDGFKDKTYTEIDYTKYDIIIGNPPFSIKKEILSFMKELDKPFMLILPIDTINRQYFINMFKNEKFQIIIPKKRINFIVHDKKISAAFFDCCYLCYKIDLDKDISFL